MLYGSWHRRARLFRKINLCKKLKAAFIEKGYKADVVSIDDFCNKRAIRYSEEFSDPEQHYFKNFDYEKFENNILKNVKNLGTLVVNTKVLDTFSDEYDKILKISLDSQSILLVEGVFIYKNGFKKYYDYSILLHIDQKEQLNRALKRDLVKNVDIEKLMNKYINRYIPAYRLYEQINKPFEYCNLVIDNTITEEPLIIKETS